MSPSIRRSSGSARTLAGALAGRECLADVNLGLGEPARAGACPGQLPKDDGNLVAGIRRHVTFEALLEPRDGVGVPTLERVGAA